MPWSSLLLGYASLFGAEPHTSRLMLTSTVPYGQYRGLKPTHVFQLLFLRGNALMGIRWKRPFSFWQWKQRNTTRTTCVASRLRSASQLKSLRPYNRAAQEIIRVIHEDRSTNAWMTASCKKEWDTFRLPSVSESESESEYLFIRSTFTSM